MVEGPAVVDAVPTLPIVSQALATIAAGMDVAMLTAARIVLDRTVMPSPEEADALRASGAFYLERFAKTPRRFFAFLDEPTPPPHVVVKPQPSWRSDRVRVRLSFPSRYEPANPALRTLHGGRCENRMVRAELWAHPEEQQRPIAVLLHGFGMGYPAIDAIALMAPQLFAAGLDLVLFTLPLHGARTPGDARFSGQLFANPETAEIAEAMGQAVHDLSALFTWLRARRDGPIGLIGLSLGGYVTALTAALRDDLDFAITLVAPACIGDLAHGFMSASTKFRAGGVLPREELRALFRFHSPLAHSPRLPPERMLIIAGLGDRVVPPRHAHWLAAHWPGARLRWFGGSHVAPFGRRDVRSAMLTFLADRGVL